MLTPPKTVSTGHLLNIGFKFTHVFADNLGIFDFTLLGNLHGTVGKLTSKTRINDEHRKKRC